MTADALAFARSLQRNAAIGGFTVLVGLAAVPLLYAHGSMLSIVFWLLLIAAALAVLAFSAHLILDAMLFRLMASFPDEMAGGRAADEFLARTGLRREPPHTRLLADRIAGTRRVMKSQRITLAIFVALFAAFAFLPSAIPAAGGS